MIKLTLIQTVDYVLARETEWLLKDAQGLLFNTISVEVLGNRTIIHIRKFAIFVSGSLGLTILVFMEK